MIIASLAALAGLVTTPEHGSYVADRSPTKAITLLDKQICTSGYVEPKKLAIQLMVQLEMFEALQTDSATTALPKFDGRYCDPTSASDPTKDRAGYCSGAVVIQRMLLNIYPGYRPTVKSGVTQAALRRDLTRLEPNEQKVVREAMVLFLSSTASEQRVECDFAPKTPIAAGGPAPAPEPDALARSGVWADVAEFGHQGARLLRVIQFRQYASNLVYRGANESFDKAHATYTAGQDLYATDAGVSFSLSQEVGDEADAGRKHTYQSKYAGAIGVPLCGLKALAGADCKSSHMVPGYASTPRFTYDFIPYYAFDRSFKKTTPLAGGGAIAKDKPTDQSEVGLVAYLATDDTPERCRANVLLGPWASTVKTCGSYWVARTFDLENDRDGSELKALNLRYTPILKTSRPGLHSFDICINTVCGDTDRILRMGALLDLRYNQGWFEDRGTNALQQAFNEDYTRIGGRVGLLGVFNPTPDLPVTFWASYTDFHPMKGFDRDLGEVQTQVNFGFSAATLAFSWRNGRREDTAKRDSTYGVKVGFKTK